MTHNEMKSRKKHAHFGTSTRPGVTLERLDDIDDGIRESHVPKSKFDSHSRSMNSVKYEGPPGPGTYTLQGDFDFRDPMNPDDKTGKLPKFHFGNKVNGRAKNLDVPGVGNVEVDQAPLWMKNVSHVFGTGFRPEPYNAANVVFPGPGEYDPPQQLG